MEGHFRPSWSGNCAARASRRAFGSREKGTFEPVSRWECYLLEVVQSRRDRRRGDRRRLSSRRPFIPFFWKTHQLTSPSLFSPLPAARDSEAFLNAMRTSERCIVSPMALKGRLFSACEYLPPPCLFSALPLTSRSPERSFLRTDFTPSKPSTGSVSLEGHDDTSRFTRPIVSVVLGLE